MFASKLREDSPEDLENQSFWRLRTEYSRGRDAGATLRYPLWVYIYYAHDDVKPREQHHKVVRAKLVEAGGAGAWGEGSCTIHDLTGGELERVVPVFLNALWQGEEVASVTWNYGACEIRLTLKSPVTAKEYKNIKSVVLMYSPCWADTREMRAAHAEWRARVASLE